MPAVVIFTGELGLRTSQFGPQVSGLSSPSSITAPSHKVLRPASGVLSNIQASNRPSQRSVLKVVGSFIDPSAPQKLSRPAQERYIPGYDDKTLQYQAGRTAEKQAAFVLPFIQPGNLVLDCGCGPGSISLGLARKVGQNGRLVGVDIEEKVVLQAQRGAEEAGLTGVTTFQQASVYSLPFEDDFFDVTFAHAVIQHLSEPSHALSEMVRVLKPGGVIALQAPDWGGFLYAPRTDALVAAIEYYMKLQGKKGGDPYAGRKLKALLQKAGVYDLDVRFSYDIDDPVAAAGFLSVKIEQSLQEGAIEKGWTTEGEVERMLSALRNDFASDPAAVWAPTRCEILGRK